MSGFLICVFGERAEVAIRDALGLDAPPSQTHAVVCPDDGARLLVNEWTQERPIRTVVLLGGFGALFQLNVLHGHFGGAQMLIVHPRLNQEMFIRRGAPWHDAYFLISHVEELEQALGLQNPLSEPTRAHLRVATGMQSEEIQQRALPRLPFPIQVMMLGGNMVIGAQEAPRRPPSPPPPPPRDWEAVLGKCEREIDEEAQCITCCTYRASIAFVPCGHQVMCDKCVRSLWEKSAHSCPVCKTAIPQLVRPVYPGRRLPTATRKRKRRLSV